MAIAVFSKILIIRINKEDTKRMIIMLHLIRVCVGVLMTKYNLVMSEGLLPLVGIRAATAGVTVTDQSSVQAPRPSRGVSPPSRVNTFIHLPIGHMVDGMHRYVKK